MTLCRFPSLGSRPSFRRRGFTLIEMAVVMSIIAVLMLLGVSALMLVRGQSIVNSAKEAAITAVREAQNRSISVSPSSEAGEVSVWGVRFDEDVSLFSLRLDDEGEVEMFIEPGGVTELMSGVEVRLEGGDHVYFSSPFGTPYLTDGKCESWTVSQKKATKELEPTGCNIVGNGENIEVTFTYQNHSESVVINKGGDISAN